MNDASEPKLSARERYPMTADQLQELADPEAMRAFAENNIAQTREMYEHYKDAFEAVMESWERTLDATGQGAVALNRKVMDLAQRNVNSGFDLAKSLAGAKNLSDILQLQTFYWQQQLQTLTAQAAEMRELTTKIISDTAAQSRPRSNRSRR